MALADVAAAAGGKAKIVRTAAGWRLKLSTWTVKADAAPDEKEIVSLTHDIAGAEIDITQQRGLSGGSYKVKLIGLPRPIVEDLLKKGRDRTKGVVVVARLSLFWRTGAPYALVDAAVSAIQTGLGVGGDEADLAGLFAVTTIAPVVDGVRYALEIAGPDVMHQILARPTEKETNDKDAPTLARKIADGLGAKPPAGGPGGLLGGLLPSPPALPGGLGGALGGGGGASAGPKADTPSIAPGTPGLSALALLAGPVAETLSDPTHDRTALGAYLLRNGKLLIGKEVLDAFRAEPIELANGIDVITVDGTRPNDGGMEPIESWRLTLRGNAAIKPGGTVRFAAPVEAPATGTGAFIADAVMSVVKLPDVLDPGKPDTTLLVQSVTHRLTRRDGFVTIVAGTVCADAKPLEPPQPRDRAGGLAPGAAASAPVRAAEQVDGWLKRGAGRTAIDIGEVRAFTAKAGGGSPGQTSSLIVGLEDRRGRANALRQLDLDRKAPGRAGGVAYATPFAWGPYGLVLPRYPGTRVVLARRGDDPNETVDLGALWWDGTSGNPKPGPPDAEDGDWWLILPADATVPSSPGETDAIAPKAKGASHDLIDGKGNRSLKVREFTLRIGETAVTAGTARPGAPGEREGLTIDVGDGKAVIEIKKDGTVSIKSAAAVTVESGKTLTLKGTEKVAVESDTAIEAKVGGTTLKVGSSAVEIS